MFHNKWAGTFLTLLFGAIGGGCAFLIGLPVPYLMGPAILISVLARFYKHFYVPESLKIICLIIIGLTMGASITPDTLAQMLNWPISLFLLLPSLYFIIQLNRFLFKRFFKFDDQTAILAATPGHLSMVISLSDELGKDVQKVMLLQSMRVLFLTILVPIMVSTMEIDLIENISLETKLPIIHSLILILISFLLGKILKRFNWPAAYLIAGMIVSTATHVTALSVGQLETYFVIPCFIVMGGLVGTRFMNVKSQTIKDMLIPGLIYCVTSILISAAFAFLVTLFLDAEFAQTIIAFAPGGVEAMISMAISLNLDSAFVATHHIFRLFLLVLIVSLLLRLPKTHNSDTEN